jgi:RNA polymerase sigma-70 factor (ECF subfamily)
MNESDDLRADLSAAVAGDQHALARLLVQQGDRLARRIRSRIDLNPFVEFTHEDVLQEVFIDAFRGIGSFCPRGKGSFPAWLDKLADNQLATLLRRAGRQKRGGHLRRLRTSTAWRSSSADLVAVLEDFRGESPSDAVKQSELAESIRRGVADLPTQQRQAMELYLEGETIDSVAGKLDHTPGTVRGLLARAKKSLRVTLGTSTKWFSRK